MFQCRELSSFLNNDNNDILPVCLWLSVVYRHRQDLLSFTRLFNCCFLLTEKQHSTHLSIWVSRNNLDDWSVNPALRFLWSKEGSELSRNILVYSFSDGITDRCDILRHFSNIWSKQYFPLLNIVPSSVISFWGHVIRANETQLNLKIHVLCFVV